MSHSSHLGQKVQKKKNFVDGSFCPLLYITKACRVEFSVACKKSPRIRNMLKVSDYNCDSLFHL